MGLESDVLGRWYYLAELTYDNALARNISQSGIPKPRAVWEVAFDCDHYPVLNFKGVPQEKLRRSSSTKNRHGMLKGEKCRTNFCQCGSIHVTDTHTDQRKAWRCGLLHKVHPARSKGSTSGLNATKDV
ncbi:hypothetical protein RB195_016735 [Necator americanus]|uniref:Uncharacterized protein n=1 Tax=Necator americanus TaxID=51031 RepID=A0ABR1C1X0_NECAM